MLFPIGKQELLTKSAIHWLSEKQRFSPMRQSSSQGQKYEALPIPRCEKRQKHPVLMVAACSNETPTTFEKTEIGRLSFHDHDIEIVTPNRFLV